MIWLWKFRIGLGFMVTDKLTSVMLGVVHIGIINPAWFRPRGPYGAWVAWPEHNMGAAWCCLRFGERLDGSSRGFRLRPSA